MDYKAELHEKITKIQAETKAGNLPRELRMEKIEALTEAYYEKAGEMPDGVALERLSDLVLWEELTDTDRMKVRNNEYPFLSETQFEERRSAEASFKFSEEHGIDGRDYKPPVRRKRTDKENKLVNKRAKIRNKERKREYDDFVKVQPVITYNLADLER